MKLFQKLNGPQKVEIIISNRTVIKIVVTAILTIVGLALLNQVSHALILIFISFFLALALNAPVHWISEHIPGRKRGSRSIATSISYVFVVLLLVGFLAIVGPPAVRQTASFIKELPHLVEDVQDQNSTLGRFVRENNLEGTVDKLSGELSGFAENAGSKAISSISAIGSSVFSIVTVLALTFMMLVEGPRWVASARRLLPEDRQDKTASISKDMYLVIKGYVNGQVTLAAIAAFMILPVMLILHIPYAIALTAIVFICGLIPMIGHTLGAIIVTLIALFESPLSAVIILAYYILYQQIENYVVQPRIQANSTNMSPLLVFMAVVIGVNLNGLLGGLVAIPVAGCLRILVIDYLQARGKLQNPKKVPAVTPDTK